MCYTSAQPATLKESSTAIAPSSCIQWPWAGRWQGLSERDTILPVVPMFHANAWGNPHAGMMMGSKFVLPGRFLDPLSIARLIADERVTVASGVPTIWIGLLQLLIKSNLIFPPCVPFTVVAQRCHGIN